MRKNIITGFLLICLLFIGMTPAVQAIGLGDIVKVGGIGILVEKFHGPLNDFINKLMREHGTSTDYATKIVPIITIGTGGYIGAAQVIGDPDLVDQTRAVLQIEGDFSGQFRIKALIPIDSINPTHFVRIQGVGVSAIIDIKI